jgi:glycogen debranching enzyme
MTWTIETGLPEPWGVELVVRAGRPGLHVAVSAPQASRIELCLFSNDGHTELVRLPLPACTHGVWHGFVPGLHAGSELGLVYGFRAHGPWEPQSGQVFHPNRLLLDPMAREVIGSTEGLALGCDAYTSGVHGTQQRQPPSLDNAGAMPKARAVDAAALRQLGSAVAPGPSVEPCRRLLLEAHVKGLTTRHPAVPSDIRGTYSGVCAPAMLEHYARLGITTISLLPVQLHASELHLLKRGLRNYWGYNTVAYAVPHPHHASSRFSNVGDEFRHMVDALHRHGVEVVLDVVFNHTAESDILGPVLSWRGLDPEGWYLHDSQGQLINHSGCGNTLDLNSRSGMRLVMDSLRWWVQVYGVDGFRFDLATVLGRSASDPDAFDPRAAVLAAMEQDPVLCRTLFIAEPWDLGPGGYRLGQFPPRWLEWNDRFRDTVRAYWLGHGATRGELAQRITGSSDAFGSRSPLASINFITAHDGFTLADLTSHARKHNDANGENNQDGHNHNLSANGGVEGTTDNPEVLALRGRWRRALLATLMVSQGTPQLLAGDEMGVSQRGNNNAYCQDNDLTALDWSRTDQSLLSWMAGLAELRRTLAILRWPKRLTGQVTDASHHWPDVVWSRPDGAPLTVADWNNPNETSMGCWLTAGARGQPQQERVGLLFNPGRQDEMFLLPPGPWRCLLDSATGTIRLPRNAQGQTPSPPITQHMRVPAQGLLLLWQSLPGGVATSNRELA